MIVRLCAFIRTILKNKMSAYLVLLLLIYGDCFVIGCSEPNNNYIYSLNSDNNDGRWTVQNKNQSILIDATVPGGIYSDLRNSNIIKDDLLFKDNDVRTRWVSYDVWKYSRSFTVSKEMLQKNSVNIVFHGLDTVAYISINSHPIATTDNMFLRYIFEVKTFLKEGLNILYVEFDSPVKIGELRSEQHFIAPNCTPDIYNGECHVNQLRKMQSSFAWDFAPAFPSVGIWKPVNLECYNGAIIRDVTTYLILVPEDSLWNLTLKVYLDVSSVLTNLEGHLIAHIDLETNKSLTIYSFVQENITNKDHIEKEMALEINTGQVKTWWPNGYGKQNLYNLRITFQSTQFVGEYFYKDMKIGFKTLELIQDPINTTDTEGLTFYFKVNDKPIFMKGSNLIPIDVLPEHGNAPIAVNHLLTSAKYAHMNMLRVWGGGAYMSDYFYERCDELGILLWQDFMFACSMYPASAPFLRSVAQEVEQTVRRLQHHTSLALWAGNNENEAALRGNWYKTAKDFNTYKAEYIKLYVDTIRPIVLSNDPTHTYVVSSPSNGIKSEEEGYIALNPYDAKYGDSHYYNYIDDLWLMDVYPKTRFCSEYGFQSIPSLETLRSATDDSEDLQLDSQFFDHREHHLGGKAMMQTQMNRQIGLLDDSEDPDSYSYFIYNSQIIQSMVMKIETEYYRQSRYDWMTMGALYWQLNDMWQAPTWSGIEYGGKWKMLHYFAKKFFSPILISPRLFLTNDISVYIINDQMEPEKNVTMTIDTFTWGNMTPISSNSTQIEILKPLNVDKFDSNIVLPSKSERTKIFYRFSLKSGTKKISPDNYIFPAKLKDIEGYKQPLIMLEVIKRTSAPDGIQYDVLVKTDGVALFVWLDINHSDGWFSDNGFIMTLPTRIIQLNLIKNVDPTNLLKSVPILTYKQKKTQD